MSRLRRLIALHPGFWLPVGIALALKLLLLVTYPLNVSGDGASYFKMVGSGRSNLMHASGYPFLLGLPVQGVRLMLTGSPRARRPDRGLPGRPRPLYPHHGRRSLP